MPSNQHKSLMRKSLESLGPLEDSEFEDFLALGNLDKIAKKEFFTIEGNEAKEFCFINQGLFKAFYTTLEGQQFVRNFAFEGNFIAPYTALLTNKKASVSIQAIEDCSIYRFNYQNLIDLREKSSNRSWERITRRLAETYYVYRERRQHQLLTLDAESRYNSFVKEVKENLSRFSQQDIASYVGITPVSLSRLRAKQKKS